MRRGNPFLSICLHCLCQYSPFIYATAVQHHKASQRRPDDSGGHRDKSQQLADGSNYLFGSRAGGCESCGGVDIYVSTTRSTAGRLRQLCPSEELQVITSQYSLIS